MGEVKLANFLNLSSFPFSSSDSSDLSVSFFDYFDINDWFSSN
jgi:hypothetical protein